MPSQGPLPAFAAAAAVVVVAIGAFFASTVDGRPDRDGGDGAAAGEATEPPPTLREVPVALAGEPQIALGSGGLQVLLPVQVQAPRAVTLAPVNLPEGFSSLQEVPVEADGPVTVTLTWEGPDCSRDVPERVLAKLVLEVAPADGGDAVRSVVDTSPADRVLRDSWAADCGIEPTPEPPDEPG